jgi:hypothetical protein
VQERGVAAFERLEIDGFIVRGALLPTPGEDTDPCEGQGTHSRLMRLALGALLLVIALRPEGMPRGFRRPLPECLAQERWALEAPVPPRFLATAFRDGGDPRLFLEFCSRGVAFPLFAKRHQESGGQDRPGAWQGVKPGEVRMCPGTWRNGVVAVFDGWQRHAALADKGLDQKRRGSNDALIRGQGGGALEGLEAGVNEIGSADVVGVEEGDEGGTARELRALRVGQRLRTSPQIAVSFSCNHCRTCGQ